MGVSISSALTCMDHQALFDDQKSEITAFECNREDTENIPSSFRHLTEFSQRFNGWQRKAPNKFTENKECPSLNLNSTSDVANKPRREPVCVTLNIHDIIKASECTIKLKDDLKIGSYQTRKQNSCINKTCNLVEQIRASRNPVEKDNFLLKAPHRYR